jgi:hypothetical protein
MHLRARSTCELTGQPQHDRAGGCARATEQLEVGQCDIRVGDTALAGASHRRESGLSSFATTSARRLGYRRALTTAPARAPPQTRMGKQNDRISAQEKKELIALVNALPAAQRRVLEKAVSQTYGK